MNLTDVATELAARLAPILNGRMTPFPPDTIEFPAGYVFGDETEYDLTYGRGADQVTLSITVAVARQPVDLAWKRINEFTAGSGDKSVKTLLESGSYESFDFVTVTGAQKTDATIAGKPAKCAVFQLDIVGSGE